MEQLKNKIERRVYGAYNTIKIIMNIKPGFTSLFNGKDLTGWEGNPDLWTVEDGVIVARSVGRLDHNEFLWYKEEFSNFIMYSEICLHGFNSGIQFRSIVNKDGSMSGYQADIGNGCWGSLYEERLRGVMVPYKPQLVEPILRKDDWNEYQIVAVSDYIMLILNGVVTAEIIDPDGAKSGLFGLQLHGGPPQEIKFRNLCIKTL